MTITRAIYLLIVFIGFTLFAAALFTHATDNNLGKDYYYVVVPIYVATAWVAIMGVLSA